MKLPIPNCHSIENSRFKQYYEENPEFVDNQWDIFAGWGQPIPWMFGKCLCK